MSGFDETQSALSQAGFLSVTASSGSYHPVHHTSPGSEPTLVECGTLYLHFWQIYTHIIAERTVLLYNHELCIILSPRMRVYFRWGQKCALFRTAPIVASCREKALQHVLTEQLRFLCSPFQYMIIPNSHCFIRQTRKILAFLSSLRAPFTRTLARLRWN